MQKMFVLQTMEFVLAPKGYIIPSFFGGLSGLLIGYRGLKIRDLNDQLQIRVQNLEKILPICSVCKKICINSDANEENRLWIDVVEHLAPQKVTHGYCPDCYNDIMKDLDVECCVQTPDQ